MTLVIGIVIYRIYWTTVTDDWWRVTDLWMVSHGHLLIDAITRCRWVSDIDYVLQRKRGCVMIIIGLSGLTDAFSRSSLTCTRRIHRSLIFYTTHLQKTRSRTRNPGLEKLSSGFGIPNQYRMIRRLRARIVHGIAALVVCGSFSVKLGANEDAGIIPCQSC